MYDKPGTYYSWGEKNKQPNVFCDQSKQRNRLNGLLSVDMKTGDEYLCFSKEAKAENIAAYFLDLCKQALAENYEILSIVLDNAKMHKVKMKTIFFNLLEAGQLSDKIKINFIHTARYSPQLNLAEYAIHLIRQKFFHHLPEGMNWEQIIKRINMYLKDNQLFTRE